jgi:hypothetical protein
MAKTDKPVEAAPAKPRISVLDRRLQNPYGEASWPIALKDDTRAARWFNSEISEDHLWKKQHDGWDPVRPEDVLDLKQIGGHSKSPDGHIVRGVRGGEHLLSMPKEWILKIAMAKTRKNNEAMGDPHRTRQAVVSAASEHFSGDIGPVGNIVDTMERIERTPEGE